MSSAGDLAGAIIGHAALLDAAGCKWGVWSADKAFGIVPSTHIAFDATRADSALMPGVGCILVHADRRGRIVGAAVFEEDAGPASYHLLHATSGSRVTFRSRDEARFHLAATAMSGGHLRGGWRWAAVNGRSDPLLRGPWRPTRQTFIPGAWPTISRRVPGRKELCKVIAWSRKLDRPSVSYSIPIGGGGGWCRTWTEAKAICDAACDAAERSRK